MNSKRLFTNRGSRSGLTLVEVLVTLTVLSILMTALFAVFKMGLSAWHKTSTKNELLQQVQIVDFRLSDELQLSALESATADPGIDALSFLSPLDANGKFILSAKGRPEFQKYIIYYRKSSDQKMYRREVLLNAGASERNVPGPIEEYDPGTGKKPLGFYTNSGQPLARYFTDFTPEVLPEPVSQVTWKLTAQRKRYGTDRPESVTTDSASYLRN